MMKKILFATTLLCAGLSVSAQSNYVINGTTDKAKDGQTVYLSLAEGSWTPVDSTTVAQGKFTFKGTQQKPSFATIGIGRSGINVILEPGDIAVAIGENAGIGGTPMNDKFQTYQNKLKEFTPQYKALGAEYKTIQKEDKAKMEAWEVKYEALQKQEDAAQKECIMANTDNIIGSFYLAKAERTLTSDEIDQIVAKASPEFKASGYTQKVINHQIAVKRGNIGVRFTDITLKDIKGQKIALSDYVGKGKYVLIDFWASWCGPCRKEMPAVKAAYEKFASKGFEIVGISLDSSQSAWEKGTADLGITWPQMSDLKGWKCEGAALYGVNSIPATLLVDPNGIIIGKNLRGDEIEKKLSEVLK